MSFLLIFFELSSAIYPIRMKPDMSCCFYRKVENLWRYACREHPRFTVDYVQVTAFNLGAEKASMNNTTSIKSFQELLRTGELWGLYNDQILKGHNTSRKCSHLETSGDYHSILSSNEAYARICETQKTL